MPESVTDRPTKAHEYVFLLTRSPRYYFDQEAVREPHARLWDETNGGSWRHGVGDAQRVAERGRAGSHSGPYPLPNPSGRNVRSVWEIEQVGRPRGARHTLHDDYFAAITTEAQAYWLGFIYADGYLGRRHLDVELAEKDAAHLDRLRAALGSSRPVTARPDGRSRFIASSLHMANALRAIGMAERAAIPAMPVELVRHFIRGVFDGDGSAWSYLPAGRPKRRYGAQMLGTEPLLTEVRAVLGLRGKPKFERGIYRIAIAAADDIARLYAFMYDGATVYLERKRVEFPQAQHVAPDVWPIATQPYPEAHFATYPEELVRRCILAGTSERGCCPVCGKPWERETSTEFVKLANRRPTRKAVQDGADMADVNSHDAMGYNRTTTLGWRPGCECEDDEASCPECDELLYMGHDPECSASQDAPPLSTIPCTVLDPFLGSGTTSYVARKHGRRSIGIELNQDYCKLAARRMQQLSLFSEAHA